MNRYKQILYRSVRIGILLPTLIPLHLGAPLRAQVIVSEPIFKLRVNICNVFLNGNPCSNILIGLKNG